METIRVCGANLGDHDAGINIAHINIVMDGQPGQQIRLKSLYRSDRYQKPAQVTGGHRSKGVADGVNQVDQCLARPRV
jgi:hypothetical protein